MRAIRKAVTNTVIPFFGCALMASGVSARAWAKQASQVAERPFAVETTQDGVPRLVQFTGTLKDSAARPIAGPASVTFAIYANQDGGTALWSETQNVLADANGHYNVLLGAASANGGLPASLFGSSEPRWLGVTVAREAEMPRVLLASVPYALKAGDADTLGGLPASAYVTTQALAASNGRTVNAGSTTILATPQAATQTGTPESGQSSVTQATPTGSGTTDYIPLWTSSSALGNSKLYQSTGGNIGVGTTTPVVLLDVNGDSIFRGSFQLVPQGTATASTGQLSHSYQWEASTYNSSTKAPVTTAFGFRATPQGNNTANPTSSLDLYYGPGGGTLTDTGLSINNAGIITFVPGQTFSGSSVSVSEINLPNSSSYTNGVISFGGGPFLADYGGITNVFLGLGSGAAGLNGSNVSPNAGLNAGVGYNSLLTLSTGQGNSAFGSLTLAGITSGQYNSAFGYGALANAYGSNNSALGLNAGATVQYGENNTLIGMGADVTSPGLVNATAIGENAKVGADDTVVLGGTGNDAVYVAIGSTTAHSYLDIVSSVSSVGSSPAPTINLSNTAGGAGANVSLDFNTSAPSYVGGYNPNSRILVLDEGGYSDSIVFQANRKPTYNNGLVNTMAIHSNGSVEIYGNLTVDGTVAKSGGSFKIDDPIAPTEKYLSHSFVESPDMMNIYNGNTVTDANGFATVEMPKWFEALNGDFRYQLTTVGQFAQAMIASEINGGKFTIQTDKPNVKVSWMVTGVRHDAWANAHRIPTEETKPDSEQGHYLHPELFGAGADKSLGSGGLPAASAARASAAAGSSQAEAAKH
jgi:hypothetical protein